MEVNDCKTSLEVELKSHFVENYGGSNLLGCFASLWRRVIHLYEWWRSLFFLIIAYFDYFTMTET